MNDRIRKATVADAVRISVLNADVQKLHADALPHIFKQPADDTFPVSSVVELMSEPNNLFLVAEVNGQVVGYLWAEIRRRPENAAQFARNTIMIHHISVSLSHQHNGYGEGLIDAVKQMAKAEGIDTVVLDTWSFNRDAQAFFARQGFTTFNYRLWTEV